MHIIASALLFNHEIAWLERTEKPRIHGEIFDNNSNFLELKEIYLLNKNICSFNWENFQMYPKYLDPNNIIIFLDKYN